MKHYIFLLAFLITTASFSQGSLITAPETSEPDSLLIYTPQKRAAHIPYTNFQAKLKASFDNIYVQPSDLAPVATSNSYNDLDDKPIFKVVQNEYANISDLYAGQASQTATFIQYVLDATGFPTVSSGSKYFEYLGTTNGDATDYRLLSDTESSELANIISNAPYNATTWNNNLEGASKNAIRDKFESMPQTLQQITDIGKITTDTIEVEGVKFNNLKNLNSIVSILGTTGNFPRGITIDSLGNIYTANFSSNNVSKITPDGTSTILGTTGNNPWGITIDSYGNVYTANYGSANVTKITPEGTSTILGTTGTQPQYIAIDSIGNIYTSDWASNRVTKITPAGVSTSYGTTGTSPRGMTIDNYGNIYTANTNPRNITKITPEGSVTTYGTTGNNPEGIAVDSYGNVYTANISSNDISKIEPDGTSTIFATVTSPRSLIFIGEDLYVNSGTSILKITPSGNKSIFGTMSTGGVRGINHDQEGNIYVVNSSEEGLVSKLTPTPYFLGLDDNNQIILKPFDFKIGSIGGGGTDDQTASEVPFTPYGTIASTNVQDAIEEVLDEIPTSLAAANITVSPAIGGNTDAYAVMDDHEDRIETLESSSTPAEIQIAASDLVTNITTGTTKAYFRMPYAMTLSEVRVSLLTAGTSTGITVDINENGTSILSTKLTTDATEKTSTTATTPAVISDNSLADDSEITIDFDAVPTGGKGVIILLKGTR